MDVVNVLIVGGQGTFLNGKFYSEYPDRELSFAYAMKVGQVARDLRYSHVICSGGYTQTDTPTLSEAESFENIWSTTQTRPGCAVVLDSVALDSAENVIFGLMALRLSEPTATLERIGFFSQWLFKKPRMTSLAADLGIQRAFYFHGHAEASKANAGDQARKGEDDQLLRMARQGDYLLRGEEWAAKRQQRHKHPDIAFEQRDAHLRQAFPRVFTALDALNRTTVRELATLGADTEATDALQQVRTRKLRALQAAFDAYVMQPQPRLLSPLSEGHVRRAGRVARHAAGVAVAAGS